MNKNLGLLSLGLGLIVYGLVLITGFALPEWAIAIWLFITGLLLVSGK